MFLIRFIWFRVVVAPWSNRIPISVKLSSGHRIPSIPLNISFGERCGVGYSVFLSTSNGAKITLGDDVTVNTGCHIVASKSIKVGNRVAIGEYVSIRDQVHNFHQGKGVRGQGFQADEVVIGDNVWIGRGVFIGPGTKIGENSIIAANSVVHGVFEPNVLIAGAPAVVKRKSAPNES